MELEAASVRRQVTRLLNSKSLEGSEVHRRLLTYLAEKTLVGEADRLKEYTVALDALGKPSTYDPRHDSVVRLQVGRLRTKLGEYYQTEGAADPIVVSLPKGGFKLSFEPVPDKKPPAPQGRDWRPIAAILAVASVLLGAWAAWATIRMQKFSRLAEPVAAVWSPDLEEIWGPFLKSGRPLAICLGTPLFLRYRSLAFVRDPGANVWDQLESSPRYAVIRKGFAGHQPDPWFSFTGVGEASGAFQLGKLLGTRRSDIQITRSNQVSWQQIADTNVVFLGPPKFNTQLQNIASKLELVLDTDGIRVLKPRSGEAQFLKDTFLSGPQSSGVTHALISCTPGLSGQGLLLTVGGNATADTYAAVQWLTSASRAKDLVSRLRQPNGEMPRYYQAIVKVRFTDGTPVESSYVLHRVL